MPKVIGNTIDFETFDLEIPLHLELPLQLRQKCLDPRPRMVFSVNDLPEKGGCYLLVCGVYVVYAGQAWNLKNRWRNHNLRREIQGLIKKSIFSSPYHLYYYLVDKCSDQVRLEEFFDQLYRPILSDKYGNPNDILPLMNSPIINGKFIDILSHCENYYTKLVKSENWQYRCSESYKDYHRFIGNYETSYADILQMSKTRKCLHISTMFSSFINPNDSVMYAKFDYSI